MKKKGITFNKEKGKYKVVYRNVFCGYYKDFKIADKVLHMVDMKYLQDYKKLMDNLKEYVNMIKGE